MLGIKPEDVLSEEEINVHLTEAFNKFDEDNSGQLGQWEFMQAWFFLGSKGSEEEINISAGQKRTIKQSLFASGSKELKDEIIPTVFDEAYEEIIKLLDTNFLKKYKGSIEEEDANRIVHWIEFLSESVPAEIYLGATQRMISMLSRDYRSKLLIE